MVMSMVVAAIQKGTWRLLVVVFVSCEGTYHGYAFSSPDLPGSWHLALEYYASQHSKRPYQDYNAYDHYPNSLKRGVCRSV